MIDIFGFSTAGDVADGLLLGLDIITLQQWAVLYLAISVLAFVLVWLLGALRQR